ncbi:MAG: hypothetical protein VKM01_03525 [Cyanobacteriota bacterium]|jgi:hypothetical protein|nr:hypothetical protein [Cyanobacteriota bacterium]
MEPSTPPSPGDPLAALSHRQRALLQILCWLAWCDHNLAEEERQLLAQIVERLMAPGPSRRAGAAVEAVLAQGGEADVEALVKVLESRDDRVLAVKLAYQMASIHQRPEDVSPINSPEKGAYRRLLAALDLPEEAVREAEWAARRDLEQPRSLLGLIGRALGGFGAWPAAADGEEELRRWL